MSLRTFKTKRSFKTTSNNQNLVTMYIYIPGSKGNEKELLNREIMYPRKEAFLGKIILWLKSEGK